MNHLLKTTTFLFALALPALAQQPTPAEVAYRDAWWADSGQGDLAAALKGYLAAAAAEGPAPVRAKALLGAGALQQRLGKTESAIATFRQLLQQFPGEADIVEQARTHLRELTAVDLRGGYDEWYQRRLFSEEVQVQILDKIQNLGNKAAERTEGSEELGRKAIEVRRLEVELLGYGPGAVPALRKAAESANQSLAQRAISLLFELGEVPPIRALQRAQDWSSWVPHWQRLLELPRESAAALRSGVTARGAFPDLLRAALAGAEALVPALVAIDDPEVLRDHPEAIGAAGYAVLQAGGPARRQMLAGILAADTPLRVREALERGLILQTEPLTLTAGEWLALGADPLSFDLRFQSVRGAARLLRQQDGELLDTLLQRVLAAPQSARDAFGAALCEGLEANSSPLQVPWSQGRLRTILMLPVTWQQGNLARTCGALQRSDATRALLVESLVGDPTPMHRAYPGGESGPGLGVHLTFEGDEHDVELQTTRWHAAVAGFLTQAWPKFDDQQRADALALFGELVRAETGDRAPLLRFLDTAGKGVSEPVQSAIAELRQRFGA